MANYDPTDPTGDPFGPPAIPTLVGCLHCGQEYESYLIEWRVATSAQSEPQGFWCCPIPDCGGIGFGCDILPVDPTYQDERGGWIQDGEEDEDEDWLEEVDALDPSLEEGDVLGPGLEERERFDDDEDLPF